MLKVFGLISNFLLIGFICLRIPRDVVGLASFETTLGSSQRTLNILIGIGIFIYFTVAISLNFSST